MKMISARIYGEGYGVAIMERTGKGRMEMKCLPVANTMHFIHKNSNQIFLCTLNDIFCQEPFQSRHNVTSSSIVLKIYRLIVFNRSGFDAQIMRKICLMVQ